jgi:hypothetical protein
VLRQRSLVAGGLWSADILPALGANTKLRVH